LWGHVVTVLFQGRSSDSTVFITTVVDNKSKFLAYNVNKAKLARSIKCWIGRPSTKAFIQYVSSNQIPNYQIIIQDIKMQSSSGELTWEVWKGKPYESSLHLCDQNPTLFLWLLCHNTDI
jgi:hypothetical protein